MDIPEIRISPAAMADTEWMVTNGLGGYGSGTLAGPASRRHDGLLVAALDAPHGRTVMLDGVVETVDGIPLFDLLAEFRLDQGLPVWRFQGLGRAIERRVVMSWRQNTVTVLYRLIAGAPVDLIVRPWLHVRHADWGVDQPLLDADVTVEDGKAEITMAPWPVVRLAWTGSVDFNDPQRTEAVYPIETERDFLDRGPLWSPGTLSATLSSAGTLDNAGAALTASTESWAVALALTPDEALAAERERRRRLLSRAHPALRQGPAALLTLAADVFVFTPRNRPELLARVQAEGDGLCSIVAGYPWFNDWGRDTMIGLEGLTLITGRWAEARDILRTFARYLKDGLIPDNIPDGPWPPVYHTADATLWFFHAVERYVAATNDTETLALILPKLAEVIDRHRDGTLFGIGVDPEDGLLRAAAEGYQLTWMDAIVGDWVVTPRRGKPVEINALWYNALSLMAGWLKGEAAERAARDAARARDSFNKRFWYAEGGYLYDVIDGDPAESPLLRPNQLFAISLTHPVLAPEHWRSVVQVIRDKLLTPYGMRSLPQDDPRYQPRFAGNQHSRDGAYHQGTVWPFLLGPFVDAWLKVWPDDRAGARAVLAAMEPHLSQYCVGTIAEVFDADPPHKPRGCPAQGWSVAEWLRAWVASA